MQDIKWDIYNDKDMTCNLVQPYDTYIANDECNNNYVTSVLTSVWSLANSARIKYSNSIDSCN